MDAEPTTGRSGRAVTRRGALEGVAALATAMGTLELAGRLAVIPERVDSTAATAVTDLPDTQFDIGRYVAPIRNAEGVMSQTPPVHTVFLTGRLLRRPTRLDQTEMDRALDTLEATYRFAADGLITHIAYGLPYFDRLPASLVRSAMPRLRANTSRPAFEEAAPGAADSPAQYPEITAGRGPGPVRIEADDLLFTLRGDDPSVVRDAISWLAGSNRLGGNLVASPAFRGLLTFTSGRAMFTQLGLPRLVATEARVPFAWFVHPRSPTWLGCAEDPVDEPGPAEICTFVGNPSARLTTARPGDYFDNAGVQHLAHVVVDLKQFFDLQAVGTAYPRLGAAVRERRMPATRARPDITTPADGRTTGKFLRTAGTGTHGDGSGPARDRATGNPTVTGSAAGPVACPPIVQWMDGPGFDDMDIPDRPFPKLQLAAFTPTAESIRSLGSERAEGSGLERLLPATRRQNYLVPPRRHRAFPLVEFS